MIRKISRENKRALILGSPIALLVAYLLAFSGRIYPKIGVCQISLTGKKQNEAQLILDGYLQSSSPIIRLVYKQQEFVLPLSSLEYLPGLTAQRAFSLGREKNFVQSLKTKIELFRQKEWLTFDYRLDQTQLESGIASVAAELFVPAVDPQIKIVQGKSEKDILIDPGKNGLEVNVRELKKEIFQRLACPEEREALAIPFTIIAPKVSPEAAQKTRERALTFLGKEIILKLEDKSWSIKEEEIISLLGFENSFSPEKIDEFTKSLAATIKANPENATFQFAEGRVTVFKPSREGISLDESRFATELEKMLSELENGQTSQEMALPIIKTPAKVAMADINNLGIQELVGQGSSLFRNSIPGRIHNIDLASQRLNGVLIAPEETFSFNQSLGDVSMETGFQQAYIIKEGRTILGDGGGVCQVSTTLFRAALNAGLPIVERHAHAYRVHYYEDDVGPGLDATVFDPSADLKIKNNTAAYLLIQTKVDLKTKKLIFEIYGTADGRKATISKTRVWDKQPPPPDLYQDDPTLPKGTIKQVDWKAWGAKVAFDYKVTRGEEVLEDRTFTSYFRPWQAVFLRGTGG